MAKLPRAVVPDTPHHVTQRGNRRQPVFFGDDDYRLYIELLGEHCRACGVVVCEKFRVHETLLMSLDCPPWVRRENSVSSPPGERDDEPDEPTLRP